MTRKAPKNRVVKIANSVANAEVKKLYDKNKTPAENLSAFGLASEVNNLKGSADSAIPLKKHAAFVGYGKIMEGNNFEDTNPRRKKISEFDMEYAALNIKKHGENYRAMEMDIKVNSRQLTAKQLEKMCGLYEDEVAAMAEAE